MIIDDAAPTIIRANRTRNHGGRCWKTPQPFFEPPFDEAFASILWSRPFATAHGPLEDVPPSERAREWPADRVARLEKVLPKRSEMGKRRFKSCAVVGSSPELLLYKDGALIDGHEAVFRANLAVTGGFEEHAGRRTAVRVINPVESHRRARKAGGNGDEMIIKNQDPPAIRSPSREHSKFLEEMSRLKDASEGEKANYLARRTVLELCNYLMLASSLTLPDGAATIAAAVARAENEGRKSKRARKKAAKASKGDAWNLANITAAFRRHASGASPSWHPMGDGIPRFSPVHCSTGSVLLTQALLTCDRVRLYGYHACSCQKKCADPKISARNHYWDKKETPRFGEMMERYEHHMLFYQQLEESCELDFKIARRDHCD